MVSRDLLKMTGANQVCARIANAGDRGVFAPGCRHHEGGSHHLRFRFALPALMNKLIRAAESLLEERYDIARRIGREDVPDSVDGNSTGDFAALMSTHAIRQRQQ